jgi:hypothetical protein
MPYFIKWVDLVGEVDRLHFIKWVDLVGEEMALTSGEGERAS